MSEQTFSSWEAKETSGLFSSGRVTISDESGFGFHPNYQGGNAPVFILRGTTDDEDFPEVEILYSLGKGWDVNADGSEAVPQKADDPRFNKNSTYWALIESAIAVGLGETLQGRGEAYENKIWHGLVVDMARVQYTLPGLQREEGARPLERVVIVGVPSAQAKAKPAGKGAATKPAAKPAAKPEPEPEDDGEGEGESTPAAASGLSAKLKIALNKLAREHDDHDEFMAAALDLEGVNGNPEAEDAISATGAGSIWAKAHA